MYFFHRPDGYCAIAVVQGTGPFTQTILGANAATDFRQGVGLVTELNCPHDVAFRHQLQPVRDVVVYRALPLTIRIAAFQATVRLRRGIILGEWMVNFTKLFFALLCRYFFRVDTPYFDKLEVVTQSFFHCDALIRLNFDAGTASPAMPSTCFNRLYSGRARVLASRLRRFAALGLTSQKRPM